MPIYQKKTRTKFKHCKEPGCGKEFWGHPIAKYCEEHSDIKNRVKKERVGPTLDDLNMVYKHDLKEPSEMSFNCCLDGCDKSYNVIIFPKQEIYPKFCTEHRNSFKRETFLRQSLKMSKQGT